jgi:hypothetical protein
MAVFGRPSEADERREEAWRQWLQRQNPLAIVAFVLGALSLTHAGTLILDGLAGVVLGVVALRQLRRSDAGTGRGGGRGLAWGGILLGGVSLVVAVYLYTLRPASAGAATSAPATTTSVK